MSASDRTPMSPIAITGAAALVPGARGTAEFWKLVLTGKDMITDVPPGHWLIEDYHSSDPAAKDRTYGRRGAFVPPVEFDPLAFGTPPNNVEATDTTQLLALMVAEQVLADSVDGDLSRIDRDRTSVILGTAPLELLATMASRLQRPVWLKALREAGVPESRAQEICGRIADHYVPWQETTFPGLLSNVVAGRIANRFDLHGSNYTTDAACASSLAALSSGIDELLLNKADMVVTGGVDTLNDILMYMCFSETGALSRTGDCRPFAEDADGTVLGEGLVMFSLRRLADAERDGDTIYAVIRGLGSSSDGRGTAVYAPQPAGQVRALRRAYESAGYGPDTVELVEAHGTGTSAGDKAELSALKKVFEEGGRTDGRWCALGSIKSQIGHTKSAAGAVGLLKAALALHHKVLPPTIKAGPHPAVALDDSPFYLSDRPRPWITTGESPRRASVSSFGFGGSNFHLTLEEYVPSSAGRPGPLLHAAPSELVVMSAGSPAALISRIGELAAVKAPLADLARAALAEFDPRAPVRAAIVTDGEGFAGKAAELAGAVREAPERPFSLPAGIHYAVGEAAAGKVAFLFSGQGSQYVGMGGDLAMHFPQARETWSAAARLPLGERPLHTVVFPPPAGDDDERTGQQAALRATEWAQPALAVQSLAQLRLLDTLGVTPDCAGGHSFGELVALHAAGAMDADDLVRLARHRGELMRDASEVAGAMAAVTADRAYVEKCVADCVLSDRLWVSAHNSPDQVVVSGEIPALEEFERTLAETGVQVRRIRTATAFHSPLVAKASSGLLDALDRITLRTTRFDVFGNTDASPYPPEPDAIRRRLVGHLSSPVNFVEEIEGMYAAGVRTFIEIGAGATVAGLVDRTLSGRDHLAVSLDREGANGVTSLHNALAALTLHGVTVDLQALWAHTTTGSPLPSEPSPGSITLTGTNYGKLYPPPGGSAALPAANPEPADAPDTQAPTAQVRPVQPEPKCLPETARRPQPGRASATAHHPMTGREVPRAAAEPAPVQDGPVGPAWLRALEESDRLTAEAHMAYQRAMTRGHEAFLAVAEQTLDVLAAQLDGQPGSLPPTALPAAPLVPAAEPPNVPVRAKVPAWQPESVLPEPVPPAAAQPAPAPLPVVPPPTPSHSEPPTDIRAVLLSVVSEKTGYPVGMLNTEMELESDLGIDSIKRVEILSALRQQLPDLQEIDPAEIVRLRSLGSIADALATDNTPHHTARPLPTPARQGTVGTALETAARFVVKATAAQAPGLRIGGLDGGDVAVTDDGSGLAGHVANLLKELGVAARVVDTVPADAHGVLFLGGMRPVRSVDEALAVNREAFHAARAFAGRTSIGGWFVTVQDTGGDFGLDEPDPVRAWLGGPAALARTARLEWQDVVVKAVDCERGNRDTRSVAVAVVEELLTGGQVSDVGLKADGTRLVVQTEERPVQPGVPPAPVGSTSVIVATGGARGVTAETLRALAREHRPRIALLGRTVLGDVPDDLPDTQDTAALTAALLDREQTAGSEVSPAELSALVSAVLAQREIHTTLADLRAAGSEVRYLAVDIRDTRALGETFDGIRREWGPITGLVHAAGVLADRLLVDKTDEDFGRVFDTKAGGLRALLAATGPDPLDLLCVFSSVAARYGNPGQGDYAMANEVIGQVTGAYAAAHPDCLVKAIEWGPWRGGMVTPALVRHYERHQVPLIPLESGAAAFVAEIADPGDVHVVIKAAGPQPWGTLGAGRLDFPGEVRVSARTHPYLADHAIAGTPVLPLALVLEWFVAAVRAAEPGSAWELQDVSVLRKVTLDGLDAAGHLLAVHASPDQDGTRLDLTDAAGTPHFRAVWRRTATVALATGTPVEPAAGRAPDYDGLLLFHGPRFHALDALHEVGTDTATATVVGARKLRWPGTGWHTDPAAIDGGLQLALVWADRVLGGPSLPMGVGAVRVHRTGLLDDPTRCEVLARKVDASQAECDVRIIDAGGAVCVELDRVRLVRRPGQPFGPTAPKGETTA